MEKGVRQNIETENPDINIDEENIDEPEQETLVMPNTCDYVAYRLAPGEGKIAVSLLFDEDVEQLVAFEGHSAPL